MKTYLTLTAWRSTPLPFLDVAFFGHAAQLGLQPADLGGSILRRRVGRRACLAVRPQPLVQAPRRHAQSVGDLANRMPPVDHLLNRFGLELGRVPRVARPHLTSVCLSMRLEGVYENRADSTRGVRPHLREAK